MACVACGVEENFKPEGEPSRFAPHVRMNLATTATNEHGTAVSAATGARFQMVKGWSTFAFGDHQGWEVSFDEGKTWEPVEVGQEIPPHPMGGLWLRAQAGASGTLRLEAAPDWDLPALRAKAAIISVSGAGKSRSNGTWVSAATPGAGGSTSAQDVSDGTQGIVTISGSVDGATTLTVEVSHDGGTTWFDADAIALGGAAEFTFDLITAAPRVRIKTSAAITISAQISWR